MANNPLHLAGAIDSDAADKAARFMQLCDAFDLPIVFLCDTPGIMVGPEAERTGTVRHVLRRHSGPVYAVAFSPDGTRLASGRYLQFRDGALRGQHWQ